MESGAVRASGGERGRRRLREAVVEPGASPAHGLAPAVARWSR
jgi:hypothetical protein